MKENDRRTGTTTVTDLITPSAREPVPPSLRHAITSSPIRVAGNDLTLFTESPPLIASMIRDIQGAQKCVWLETYIFLDDPAGQAVAEALMERARAGVEVRVLYDAIGSRPTPGVFFQQMREAGVQVHCFHSLWEALTRFAPLQILNRRDHRKLLVVDDYAGYFGGMNIVDQSSIAALGAAEHYPTSAGWRDVHARMTGPQVPELAESFDRSWRRARGEKVSRRPKAYRRALLAGGAESLQFFDGGPGLRYTRAARIFLRLIRSARRRISFSMAYFLPVGPVLRALLRAHRRGVLIRLVVPGNSDIPVVQRATRHLYRKLLRRRFHIWERQQNMLHSKVMVVDDEWAVVGSSNLDARSLYLHLEFLAVAHSRPLASAINEVIDFEIQHSKRITPREYLQRGCWERWADRLAWELRWWL